MKKVFGEHITDDYWASKQKDDKIDVVKERAFTFNRLLKKGEIKKILDDNLGSIESSLDDIHEAIDREGTYDVDFMGHLEKEKLDIFIKSRIKKKYNL